MSCCSFVACCNKLQQSCKCHFRAVVHCITAGVTPCTHRSQFRASLGHVSARPRVWPLVSTCMLVHGIVRRPSRDRPPIASRVCPDRPATVAGSPPDIPRGPTPSQRVHRDYPKIAIPNVPRATHDCPTIGTRLFQTRSGALREKNRGMS